MRVDCILKLNALQLERERVVEREKRAVQRAVFPIDANFNVQFPIESDSKENYCQRGTDLSCECACAIHIDIKYAKIFQSEIVVCNVTWNKCKLARERVRWRQSVVVKVIAKSQMWMLLNHSAYFNADSS